MKSWKPDLAPFRKYKVKVFERAALVSNFIYQIGESPILRQSSKPVPVNQITSKIFQQKIKYLKNCLLKYRKLTGMGRGIAAPQVGIHERFAVIYNPNSHSSSGKLVTIINPKITKFSKEKNKYPEMCMSANPVIVPLIRPTWIEFEYFDEMGQLQEWKTKHHTLLGKKLNRVFQHEIDHLDGIINLDRGDPKEFILESGPKFYKNAKFEEV
ncbi:peptide deformylase [Candidatus Daviesbacteria bacterium]|nr:peptide deformylase [Candidatus Daviesbacteria bacterium]